MCLRCLIQFEEHFGLLIDSFEDLEWSSPPAKAIHEHQTQHVVYMGDSVYTVLHSAVSIEAT